MEVDEDQRSYQSEEAIKPDDGQKPLSPEHLALIEQIKNEREQSKIDELTKQMKERFGMQDFDIEIRKINDDGSNA